MTNARNSTKARRICWATHRTTHVLTGALVLICKSCRQYIDPIKDEWRADTEDNLFPVCIGCAGGKAAQHEQTHNKEPLL